MQALLRGILAGASIAVALTAALPGPAAAQSSLGDGTLTWGYYTRPRSLDPNIWSGGSDLGVMRQIYDTLIWSPESGAFEPGLATAWEMSDDGLTYTFTLRDDVTFHDGTPFNAEAVKFMFDRIKDPASKSLNIGAIGPFESAEVLDEYKVAIHLSRPWGAFLTNVSEPHLSPVSPKAVAEMGEGVANHPVGTGPFMFDKWEGNDVHLVKNPDYNWGPAFVGHEGPSAVERLVVKEVPEASTRINALRSGEVDLTHFPVLSQVAALEGEGYKITRVPQPGFSWSLPINVEKAPTDDLKVRQAMLYAINNEAIVRAVLFNQHPPAYGPLTATTFGYDPAVKDMWGYDPEKAAALLDEAGWTMGANGIREKDGEPLTIEMAMFDSSVNKQVTELAQAMLKKIGIDANLTVQNYPAFAAQVADQNYHTAQMRWSAVDPDQVIPTMFSSEQVDGGGQFNRTRIKDPALDALITEAGAATDPAKRAEFYAEIQKQAMENVWLLPIFDDVWFWIGQGDIDHLVYDRQGRPILYAAEAAK